MTTGMEYFLVLAEEQSISRAAQRLFVTQQSMSEQMKRLEQIYGAKLFIRRPRFQLTAAGEALLSAARQIRILEQGLTVQLHNIQEKGGGQLRIGIHATRARMFLPQAVEQFYRVFPNVELIFFHDDTRDFEQMLLNGDLDLFLGWTPLRFRSLKRSPWQRNRFTSLRQNLFWSASWAGISHCRGIRFSPRN